MARSGGLVGRAIEALEERTGYTIERADRLNYLEEAAQDRRVLQRELEDIGYAVLDYAGGMPQDLTIESRRTLVAKSRRVVQRDPLAGASVELMNDFVFGRGVPKAKAKDSEVQKVIDEFWDDPANKRILTTHEAQLALGYDLSIQCNLFFLFFDDGPDGRVRVSLLEHDSVLDIITDWEDDRFCPLFYKTALRRRRYDYLTDTWVVDPSSMVTAQGQNIRYYEDISGYDEVVEQAKKDPSKAAPDRPPDEKMGDGKVLHVRLNRGTESLWGHPRMDRTIRWYQAFNRFMEARVDMMVASAAYIMKVQAKGTPQQLAKLATRALSRRSEIAATDDPSLPKQAPARGGGIVQENDTLKHEPFNLTTNAANAQQDAQGLRAQVSAAERWHQGYLGDASALNLSSATSLELPILKAVENRQEFFAQVFRTGIDRAIERAVDTGRIKRQLTPEEIAARRKAEGTDLPTEPGDPDAETELVAAHQGQAEDEEATQRDLSYEFAMPNPLKRAMNDVVMAAMNIAKTFDPNNTNVHLSRALLLVCLSDGLDLQDAADLVEKIFPPGYVDPAVAAAQAQMQGPPQQPPSDGTDGSFGEFGPDAGAQGADGQQHGPDNPYGAPINPRSPEQVARMQQARWWPRDRAGEPLDEYAIWDLPSVKKALDGRKRAVEGDFEALERAALSAAHVGRNGNGGET